MSDLKIDLKRFAWANLKFRSQLAVSHFIFVFAALSCVLIFFAIDGYNSFIDRGFDLLKVSNTLSVKRFYAEANLLDVEFDNCLSTKNQECIERKVDILLTDRTGLGESGENYLVDEVGRLVSASRFLKNPDQAPIPKDISNFWVGLKKDYRNIDVLAVWTKVKIGSFSGYLASEIDKEEVLRPFKKMIYSMFLISGLFLLLIICSMSLLSRFLARNVERLQENEKVRALALVEGQEFERQKISHELHDDLGQKMTVLSLKISSSDIPSNLQNELVSDLNLVANQIKTVSSELSTYTLQHSGLYQALQDNLILVSKACKAMNIDFSYTLLGSEDNFLIFNQSLALTIFRAVQELSNNLLKHSVAERAECKIKLERGHIHMLFADNGIGVSPTQRSLILSKGSGIKALKARVEAQGGLFKLETNLNEGFSVEISFFEPKDLLNERSYC